jgi:hypothetical protein
MKDNLCLKSVLS